MNRLLHAATLAAILALASPAAPADEPELFDAETREFLSQVKAGKLARLPVQLHGRIGVLDTLAREQVALMHGETGPQGIAPAVAYLELYFNAGAYLDRPLLYVREKTMRGWVAGALEGPVAEEFRRTNRIRPISIMDNRGLGLLLTLGRASRAQVRGAMRDAGALLGRLPSAESPEMRVPLERLNERYAAFLALERFHVAPGDDPWQSMNALLAADPPAGEFADRARRVRNAWRRRDAELVNRRLDEWTAAVSSAAPSGTMTDLELLYNRSRQFTFAWIGFAVSFLVLLVAAAAPRLRWVRRIGLALLGLTTVVLAVGFGIRWALSGRAWYLPPIMNQFEAVIGSALLGAAVALVIELARPRNFIALAAAFYGTLSLLSGWWMPRQMGAAIEAQAGILHSPIMAVHVAAIIFGHALVGMTIFISLVYLAARAVASLRGRAGAPSAPADLTRPPEAGVLAGLDRCNLIVAQLGAWTVVLGTILGAYWADFAWGRWWGWDPKENYALITALIFVGVIHLRFVASARTRGLLTAVGCLLGGAAMLFNWIVVNYVLPGLHSYA